MKEIEFWIEYASTYSYLSVAGIGKLAEQRGVEIDWQPFWLYPVREQQGLPMPFPQGSARAAYMWRDGACEQLCAGPLLTWPNLKGAMSRVHSCPALISGTTLS